MRARLVGDPRAEVGEDVLVGVGAVECQLIVALASAAVANKQQLGYLSVSGVMTSRSVQPRYSFMYVKLTSVMDTTHWSSSARK